jgi:NAD-dependent SIR2 family protein deacetylase
MPQSASISDFCAALLSSRPVLFLGAGISVAPPSNLPVARELIQAFYLALTRDAQVSDLAGELPSHPLDLLNSPELIYNAVAEYAVAIVPSLFQAALDCERPNVNHWVAARMVKRGLAERLVTTNFDRLLERSLGGEPLRPSRPGRYDPGRRPLAPRRRQSSRRALAESRRRAHPSAPSG